MNHKLHIVACFAGAALLCGCAPSNSTRTDIGGGERLPSLAPSDERAEHVPQDGRSTDALSRQNWRPVVVEVPVYGIAAQETYSTQWRMTSTTHRQRGGEFPTAATSLQEFGDTTWEQRAEAAAAPFVFLGDVVMMPYRMVMTPQWTEVPAQTETYGRSSMFTAKKPLAPAPTAPSAPTAAPAQKDDAK